jgi:histidinol-phosphate aminotransferase
MRRAGAAVSGFELPLRPELRVPVQLNVNENPYPPPAGVLAAIGTAVTAAAADLNRYPDRECLALRADLAGYLATDSPVRLTADQLWPANGSNEIMQQLLQAFGGPGRTALSFDPTYSMYPEYARNTHTGWLTGPRTAGFEIDLAAAADLLALLELAPGMLVVDEAYAEFRRAGVPSALELLADHPQLVVTRTMSKAFAFAGGRVGYLAASAAVVDAVRIVRLPYHLSALSQAAAGAALAHSTELLANVEALRIERDATVDWLRSIGLEAADSDANFVLFGRFADRHAIWQQLLERGVLIRETGPDGWLRVSIGTAAEMRAFRQALRELVAAPVPAGRTMEGRITS